MKFCFPTCTWIASQININFSATNWVLKILWLNKFLKKTVFSEKTIKKHSWKDMTVLKGRVCLATKINVTFFVGNEVLHVFYETIFSKKKINKKAIFFSEITLENNFFGREEDDQIWGNGASDDKNEYNLFYRKWDTVYCFKFFSSQKFISSGLKAKNWFWGHSYP